MKQELERREQEGHGVKNWNWKCMLEVGDWDKSFI